MKNIQNYKHLVFVGFIILFLTRSCGQPAKKSIVLVSNEPMSQPDPTTAPEIVVAANRTQHYLPLLKDKKVAVVANNTSVIFKSGSQENSHTHLVDSLRSLGVQVQKVFAPEHGFRGDADAGAKIKDEKDPKTKLPVISLYGANYKPSAAQLQGVELVLFDIQDVGARFYTYISTLHYVMEACAENRIPLLVLDRPNPNGHYIDGPVLKKGFESFVGLHPVPMVYGMTIGEYAQMINGEHWLKDGRQAALTVIPLENYTHQTSYSLPLRPSPNLPNDTSINLYPSLCLFEGTNVNAGRGTETQFQVFGSPYLPKEMYKFRYTPVANFGAAAPKHKGLQCYGMNLTQTKPLAALELQWLIDAYKHTASQKEFFQFAPFFDKLAGTDLLRKQILEGQAWEAIKSSWKSDLDAFKVIRAKYVFYE